MRECPNCDEQLSLRNITRMVLAQQVVCSLCRRELIINRKVLFALVAVLLALSPLLLSVLPKNLLQLLIAVPVVLAAVWGVALTFPIEVVEEQG